MAAFCSEIDGFFFGDVLVFGAEFTSGGSGFDIFGLFGFMIQEV